MSLSVPVLLSICLPLLVGLFAKSDCVLINLALSMVNIITILLFTIKLLQMICGYIASFVVYQLFCLFLCLYP